MVVFASWNTSYHSIDWRCSSGGFTIFLRCSTWERAGLNGKYPKLTKPNKLGGLQSFIHQSSIDAESIDALRRLFNLAYDTHAYELTDVFIWPFQLSGEFLTLLKQYRHEAMVIFAYFSMLLGRFNGY